MVADDESTLKVPKEIRELILQRDTTKDGSVIKEKNDQIQPLLQKQKRSVDEVRGK